MQKFNSIKEAVQAMQVTEGEVSIGIIESISPLAIRLLNDEKFRFTDRTSIVPEHLRDHSVKMSFTVHDHSFNDKVTIYNGLKHGEKVILMTYNHKRNCVVVGRM